MKKSRIFVGIAAFSLAITGFFVTKANSKKGANFAIQLKNQTSGIALGNGTANGTLYTITPSSGKTVLVQEAGNLIVTVVTTTHQSPVYHF